MVQRTLVRIVDFRAVFQRQEILADETSRFVLRRINDITIRIPTILINVFLIFVQGFTCLYKLRELVFTGNLRTAGFNDSPLQPFRIAGIYIGLFQIGSRLTPTPTVARAVTGTGDGGKRTT